MDVDREAAQRVGTTLCNKWTLERLLGTGGMAAVYVATHKIGRREAIKILHSDVARDPELRARFEQEAHAVNRFEHPGKVEVRDIDVAEDGSPFLVMELLEGHSLAELARQPGGVELGDLLRLCDDILDVLAAAHAQGIIHRDIKPDNLFVLHDGRLKVLDFGIARVRAGVPAKLRTRVGAKLGTAPYMPPEQIRGVEIDARADLFAVGATLFRLIAGRHVHEAEGEAEMLLKMANEPAPPLLSVAPGAPSGVCLVVDRALMLDREQRYPDALTMQGDVRALREGRPPPFASIPPRPASKPRGEGGGETLRHPPAPLDGEVRAASAKVTAAPERTSAASPGAIHPLEMPAPQAPSAERTLRSVQGLEGAGATVAPQGYVMATTALPQVHLPQASADQEAGTSSRSPGPRTQLSGVAPLPLAPGESVPVVPAPPRPSRYSGTGVSVLPLVLVGVVFAALGVGLTLWLMLSNTESPPPSAPHELVPAHGSLLAPTTPPPVKPTAVKSPHKPPWK